MKQLTRKLVAFSSLVAMAFLLMLSYPARASADESTNNLLSQFEYLDVNYDDTLGFIYNDGFFFLGNNHLSPELAKVSVSLATAAYDLNEDGSYEELYTLLDGLECSSYELINYNRSHKGDDYDWVRYAIASREINFQSQPYIIYFVPVQGTRGSYDWFGNAKLGTGSDHEGFSIAADKVMQELSSVMSVDGYSRDTRIILTTGHSRGAAVSNIIAGKLTEGASGLISPNHVFSYNFACPSVSTNANENFQNIYNFNSGDDLIPVLPLKDWGYKRYGVTIDLTPTVPGINDSEVNNVKQRFSSYTGSEYAGTYRTPIDIENILNRAIPDKAAANDLVEPILKGLAFLMENADGSMKDFFFAMDIDIDISENRLSAVKREFKFSEEEYRELQKRWEEMVERIPYYLEKTVPMTKGGYEGESFSGWFEQHRAEIEEMESVFDYDISSSNSHAFIQDIQAIYGLATADTINAEGEVGLRDSKDIANLLTCGVELYSYFHNGGSVDSIIHAHDYRTYLLWINSMYFGCSGWRNNTQEQIGLTRDGVLTIAPYCFADSSIITVSPLDTVCCFAENSFCNSGLENLSISDAIIGQSAFSNCTSLRKVEIGDNVTTIGKRAFYNCSGLTELSLGKNITNIGPHAFYCCSALETLNYNARNITELGDAAFIHAGRDGNGISVIMGDAVENVPAYLFGSQQPDTSWDAGANIKSAVIGSNVTSIGSYAFDCCKNLKKLTIPAAVADINSYAFSGCTALEDVYYSGGSEEWALINIAYGNNPLISANIHFDPRTLTPDFILPAAMTTIEDEAFAGGAFIYVKLPENAVSIGSRAFTDCPNLAYIYIPALTTQIDEEAFGNIQDLTILGKTGTAAETYAQKHHFTFIAVP